VGGRRLAIADQVLHKGRDLVSGAIGYHSPGLS
jgi:hypothetical protein